MFRHPPPRQPPPRRPRGIIAALASVHGCGLPPQKTVPSLDTSPVISPHAVQVGTSWEDGPPVGVRGHPPASHAPGPFSHDLSQTLVWPMRGLDSRLHIVTSEVQGETSRGGG